MHLMNNHMYKGGHKGDRGEGLPPFVNLWGGIQPPPQINLKIPYPKPSKKNQIKRARLN